MRRANVKSRAVRRKLPIMLWALALGLALLPLPPTLVERLYWRTLYLGFQPFITLLSNTVPVALLDVGVFVLLGVLAAVVLRARRTGGWRTASSAGTIWLLTTVAVIYVLFLASWGFNYRRVPLEQKLDFERTRISRDAAIRLAGEAAARLNAGYTDAHAQPFRPDVLEYAFIDAQWTLGRTFTATTGRPKKSLFGFYFRKAAIDGMTVPVFLEIILNPDLLPVEKPSVLAHEWAHLGGYADESEASFVAWIAGVRSEDPVARYSAWLDAYRLSMSLLPREVGASVRPLAEGPRSDLRAIAERYERSSPRIRTAARGVYDSYLRANRIDEGIANYDVVLQLILGTAFDSDWKPRIR